MTHSSQVEIERKYDVDAAPQIPELTGAGTIAVVEDVEVIELVAVYFDTAAFALASHRVALRRREGGADAGWHIKSKQTDAEGRTELHWPLSEGDADVPSAIREQVAHLIDDEELVPVACLSNRRENRRLLDAAGYPVAELSDDHVHAENLVDGSVRDWREWEVELLSAAPDTRRGRDALLDAIESRLLTAGARVSSSSSKLARALGVDSNL
jgi:inorganic triphosphatase YgiF